MFEAEKLLNNHPNIVVRKMYRSAIIQIWPKLIFKLNKWVVISSTSLFTISMLLFVIGKQKEKDECIADPECRMVFMGYYYFPWDTDKYYWFANLETAFFGTCLSTISYYKDMYVASFICCLRGRFSVLCYKVNHLEEFAMTTQDGQDLSSKIHGMLKQCIREHQDIIRFVWNIFVWFS
ncbi:hypothetical protein WA026_007319 [Henosepilachna vigintioctopunctata]|uniref:Odorant receptor n=1 Tax=Henosepilachna vigintioctopunctata TaxID=420089 RepID=A0AAW1UXB8_9CUCU